MFPHLHSALTSFVSSPSLFLLVFITVATIICFLVSRPWCSPEFSIPCLPSLPILGSLPWLGGGLPPHLLFTEMTHR